MNPNHKPIQKLIEVKRNGKSYQPKHTITDSADVYQSLANDLAYKYVNHCSFIKRVTRKPNYDGTCDITVYYNNGVRAIYTVEA